MKKLMTMALMVLMVLGASFVIAASAAASVPYQFDGVTSYQEPGPVPDFGPPAAPDTGFVTITNNGPSTFTGTIGFNAVSECFGDYSASYAVTLIPGASKTLTVADDSSNFCGFNGPFDTSTPQQGAEFFMNGTVTLGLNTDAVALSIFDKDVHSGVFQTNPFGVSLDNYILQGGDPFGRDTGDPYELSQASGKFQFATCPSNFDFDFGGSQYADCFRDLLQGPKINSGLDLGGTGNTALNFTGTSGSTPSTWLTVYDKAPATTTEDSTFGAEILCADVLIQQFNNAKGVGVVALLNEGGTNKGLALYISDAGNTDKLFLSTINPTSGLLTTLTSVPLPPTTGGGGITENVWYRLVMTVDPVTPKVTGQVFRHTIPTSPNSPLGLQVGGTLTYTAALPAGVTSPGENGIMATATNAVVNSSVTNFTNDPTKCP